MCEEILQGKPLEVDTQKIPEIAATTMELQEMQSRMQNDSSPTSTDALQALESASTTSSSIPVATKRGKTSGWLLTIFWAVTALLFAIVCTYALILKYNTLVDSLIHQEQWNANFGGLVAANQALHDIQQMGTVTSQVSAKLYELCSAIWETNSGLFKMIAWWTSLVALLALTLNPPAGASMLVTSVTNAGVAWKAAVEGCKFGYSVGRGLLCLFAALMVLLLLDVIITYISNVPWNFVVWKTLQTVGWSVLGMFGAIFVDYIIPWGFSMAYTYSLSLVEITGGYTLFLLWCSKDGGNKDKTDEEPITSIELSHVRNVSSNQEAINDNFTVVVIVLQLLGQEKPFEMDRRGRRCKLYIFGLPECPEVDQRYLRKFWLYMVAQAVIEKYNGTEDALEKLLTKKKRLSLVIKKPRESFWKPWATKYDATDITQWVTFTDQRTSHAYNLDFPPFEHRLIRHQKCQDWFDFLRSFCFDSVPDPCLLEMYEKIANSVVGQDPSTFNPNSIQELCYKVHQEMQRMQASKEQSRKASEDEKKLSKLQFSRSSRRMIGTVIILLVMILIPFSGLCIHWNMQQMVTSSVQNNPLNTTVAFNATLHAEKDKEEQHHRIHKKCPEGNYTKDSYYYSVLCKPHDFVEPVQKESSTTTKEEVTNEQPPPTEQVATTDLSNTNVTVPVLKWNCEPMLPKDTSWPTRFVCHSYRVFLRLWYRVGYKTKVVMPSGIQKIGKQIEKAMQYVDTFFEYTTYYVQQFELSKPTYFLDRANEHPWDHCVLVCQNCLHCMAIVGILTLGFPKLKNWISGCKD